MATTEEMDVAETPSVPMIPTTPAVPIVLPGDDLTEAVAGSASGGDKLKIAQGIAVEPSAAPGVFRFVADSPGELQRSSRSQAVSVSVDTSRRRYLARAGDQVVGVVEERGGDFYLVNVFGGALALLPRLAFEGATKRNKPELKRGDVVFARVTSASKDMDTELTCVSSAGSRKEWSSGETETGPLSLGLLVRVSTGMARRLLRPDCALLAALKKHYQFEIAVGLNGAVWFRTHDSNAVDSIVIRNALLNAELLSDAQCEAMVLNIVQMSAKAKRRNA